jgi:hypothetical protein
MKLNIKALAFASAVIWGGAVLLTGLLNLIWPAYAVTFLKVMASVYPGYDAAPSLGNVIVGTVYALLDGALFGLIFGWLYNRMVPSKKT